MSNNNHFQHWHLRQDADGIVWLFIDRNDSSANSLNREVLTEFNAILDDLRNMTPPPRGVIIASAKKSGFIPGADITQFTQLTSVEEAVNLIRQGQQIFDKLVALPMPTCAMIDGFCLGGGFELALACRYRVAEDGPKTKLGLPEILLGIHPGWGGTIRLPRLIGAVNAMQAILTGKLIDARKAAKLGMIDAAVPKRHLETVARWFVLNHPAPHHATFLQSLTNYAWVRPLLAKQMRKQVATKASAKHYPAPYAVIDNWVREGVSGEQAMITEANSIGKLLLSDTSRNLVRIFFLRERLKSLGKKSNFKAQHVHVIGAGAMGGDIAAWCALRGLTVTLQDREPRFIAPAIKRAYQLFQKRLKIPRLIQAAMDRLLPDTAGTGVRKADVIIEAIFEDCAVKQNLFKQLEQQAKPTAILATNTSSIPLDDINKVLQQPERLVGIHFFNPVAMLDLVEVIRGAKTSEQVFDNALAFVRSIDKLPLPVKSSPGFLVNRVLMAYLMEAVALHSEGIPMAVIDKAAVDFGMPMGPIELADSVGLDVCLAVANYLTKTLGGTVPEVLKQKVAAGELGRKTGKGLYDYDKKGKALKSAVAKEYQPPVDLTARMILRMVNEAAACLREGVIADADLLDAGMIFGTGFAPFRGGPMQYSKSEGIEKFRERLAQLERQYGERFKQDI